MKKCLVVVLFSIFVLGGCGAVAKRPTVGAEISAPLVSSSEESPLTEEPRLTVGTEFRDHLASGGEGPLMVVLPEGQFWQGSPEDEWRRDFDEGTQRLVTISYPLAVGKYEVTNAEYARCVADNSCQSPHDSMDIDHMPVSGINWYATQKYIAWLNRETGLDRGPATYRYRLLSESEWEYAARGEQNGPKASTPFARLLRPDGTWTDGRCIDPSLENHRGDLAAYGDCPKSTTYLDQRWEVGSSGAVNAFGLADMYGNVAEWVMDCWNYGYVNAPSDGQAWEAWRDCDDRVVRGGFWSAYPQSLRSADRSSEGVTFAFRYGIRLARTLPP